MHYRLKLAEHVSMTEMDDEAVLVDLNSGAYFGLNHVGLAFITQLELGVDTETAIQSIVSDYDVCALTVNKDIQALVNEMLNKRLLMPLNQTQ